MAVKSACSTGKRVQMLKYIDQIDNNVAIACITRRFCQLIQKCMCQTKLRDFKLYSDIRVGL